MLQDLLRTHPRSPPPARCMLMSCSAGVQAEFKPKRRRTTKYGAVRTSGHRRCATSTAKSAAGETDVEM